MAPVLKALLKSEQITRSLADLSHALISNSVSIQSISDSVLEHVRAATGAEHGFVSAIDPETGNNIGYTLTNMMGDSCHLSQEDQKVAFPVKPDGTYPGLWGQALTTKKPFYTNKPPSHPSSTGLPPGHIPLRNFLAIPVMVGNKVLGEVALANKEGQFTDKDLVTAQHFANIYAVALQRRRTEDALAAIEKEKRLTLEGRYQAFLQASPDMLHLLCRDGVFIDTHPGNVPCALDPAKYLGKSLGEIFDKEFTAKAMKMLHAALDEGTVQTWEYTLPQLPSSTYEARFTRTGSNEALVMIRDISRTRDLTSQLEKTVQERTRELEDSNSDLQSYAYAASHDLREPLSKILGFGNRLKSTLGEGLDPKSQGYLDIMMNAATRMTDLIDGLLAFSRIAGIEDPIEVVDLQVVMQQAVSDLGEAIKETGATLDLGPLPMVEGHPSLLEQVFRNLLSNAIKFSKDGVTPHVEVRGSTSNGTATITVKDNGIGFDPSESDMIFQVFKRLHTRFEYPGTGIGLALCKRVVSRYGGTIRAESSPGQGATFTIQMPMRLEESENAT